MKPIFALGFGLGFGFIVSQAVFFAVTSPYVFQTGITEGRSQIVRECPSAQNGEMLISTYQHPDGQVYCSYADNYAAYGQAKRWRQAQHQK